MTDCTSWLENLTHTAEIILEEDLAALERMPERSRIERYNEIKSDEEELLWEFSQECDEFLTEPERKHIRGELRLARLLLAASFYANDELPNAMEGDFIEQELQAVVDFDRYKQFDALDEDQIEERIRRMEGEVYELVTEYTSTQIANMDELIDDPDVQQDVIERLVDRYDERREKIRQGFFIYVETHGLEHMVEAIENAVTAVSESANERERIRSELESELNELAESIEQEFDEQRRQVESQLHSLERQISETNVSENELINALDRLDEQSNVFSRSQQEAVAKLESQIDRTESLQTQLEEKIAELESVRKETRQADRAAAREEAADLVEDELEKLRDERGELEAEIERLRRERESIETTRERLDERRDDLESRVQDIEKSFDTTTAIEEGVEGGNLITATIARLLELDYLGRFDIAMHDATSIHTPEGQLEISDGYWEDRSERRSERPQLADLLPENEDPYQYPTNQSARYEVTDSRLLGFGSETTMVIEVLVLSHLEAYATNGFDTQPADLDDLLDAVNEAVTEAEETDRAHLLALASPTGWTERVRRQVDADEFSRTRYSRHVSVCLVDLQDGSLIYDESDPLVSENAGLFEPPIDAERTEACATVIREQYAEDVATDSVMIEELASEHDFDVHVVKRAFDHLADDGIGEQIYVDDVGLALYFDR